MKSPLGTGSGERSYDMDEKDIVDKFEPATASTLHAQGGATMRYLLKQLALLCLITDIEFRSSSESHEPGIGKVLHGRNDLVLDKLSYNV